MSLHSLHIGFLRVMLWMMRYEFVIGRSTGRNPAGLSALRCDITQMEGDLMRLEMRW